MGTSASSRGPGSGPDVPIIPPWVDNPPLVPKPQTPPSQIPFPGQRQPTRPQSPASPQPNSPLPVTQPSASPSQPGRWRAVRTSLGKFAGGGGDRGKHLRRGLGHYSRSGMGGSGNAARRMNGSARAAGALHEALTSLAAGQPLPPDLGIDPLALAGLSSAEIIDVLVDAIRPIDGTQDAEATRDSVSRALSEALSQSNGVTPLTPQQIDQVTANTLGLDVAHRIELDVGKAVIDKAPTKGEGLERLQEMKDYVREVVAAAYADERQRNGAVGRAVIERISRDAIEQAFQVFEDEAGL